MTRRVELLSPAGNMEKLKNVFRYGADAAYLGGKAFNLRAASHNFSKNELKDAVDYAHALGKKVYITLNILARNYDIKLLPPFISYLNEIGVDAVIVADMGIVELVQEHSSIPIHISTQASTTNWRGVKVWQKLGAKRVVLAREVSLDEIKRIKDAVPEMELEVFVHGAMCMAYSGRCQLSSYMADKRDSNHGMCTNTCRWKYSLMEEKRPGQFYPVYEDDTGSYIYNAKDLCTIEFLDKIIEAGVDGLKIEGRNRGLLYGATTAKVYSEAKKAALSGQWELNPQWRRELESFNPRGYSTGFFFGALDKHATKFDASEKESTHELCGVIQGIHTDGRYIVNVKNQMKAQWPLQILSPDRPVWRGTWDVAHVLDSGEARTVLNPNHVALMTLPGDFAAGDLLRQPLDPESDPTLLESENLHEGDASEEDGFTFPISSPQEY